MQRLYLCLLLQLTVKKVVNAAIVSLFIVTAYCKESSGCSDCISVYCYSFDCSSHCIQKYWMQRLFIVTAYCKTTNIRQPLYVRASTWHTFDREQYKHVDITNYNHSVI